MFKGPFILKRIISSVTATVLMTAMISFVGATTANAVPTITVLKYLTGGSEVSVAGFSSGTTSYSVNVSYSTVSISSISWSGGGTPTYRCNGTTITMTADCNLNSGANTYTITLPAAPTNTYTITFNYTAPVAPVIASTSTITAGQVNPTIVLTSTSTFRANPDYTNANFSISAGGTNLTKSVITLSGNTITMALTGTAQPGTLVLTASGAAFDPNPGTSAATLQFVVAKVPATANALTFQGGSTQGPTANGSAPSFMNGGSGEWNVDSSITWSPSLTNSRFAAGVVYTATVTLGPSGATFEGLSSSFFTFAGATSVSATYSGNPRTSATVAIVFPATAGGSSSSASCSADLLSSSSTIKGVAITLGQSRASAQFSDFYTPGPLRGSVNLTEAQATGSGTTSMTTTDGSAVYWLYIAPGINSFSHSNISGISNQSSESVVSGRDFIVRVVPTTCAEQYYWLTIVVGSSVSSESSQQNAQAQAAATAAAQTAAVLATTIAKANVAIAAQFATNKPATLGQFLDAGYGVRNDNVAAKASAAILKLSAADRENTHKIIEIISREDFIDRVAVTETRSTVRSTELISRGLLAADSTKKHSVIQGLASYPDGSLNSLEKIEAAIKEQIAKAQAPRLRTVEIRARIAARNK